MISQWLVNVVKSHLSDGQDLPSVLTAELLNNYIALIEQNAELHKELAKLKGDRVFVVNNGGVDYEV